MYIKRIIEQYRRDFTAVYACQYCGSEYEGTGYDDDNFHRNVIPKMPCKKCNKIVDDTIIYRPLTTKYPPGYLV